MPSELQYANISLSMCLSIEQQCTGRLPISATTSYGLNVVHQIVRRSKVNNASNIRSVHTHTNAIVHITIRSGDEYEVKY